MSEDTGQNRPDRGRLVAHGAMAGLVLLGVALILRGPRAPAAPPSAATLTGAAVAVASGAPKAPSLDGGGSGPSTDGAGTEVSEADAGPRPAPVFRVASLATDPGIEIVEGVYGKRSLSVALGAAGVARTEVRRLARAFDGVHRIEHPAAKDAFVLARDRAKGSIVAFEHIASPVDVWQVRLDEGSTEPRLVAKRLELYVEHKKVASALTVSADLAKAASAASLREGAVEAIDDALEGHVDLATIRPGVRLRVIGVEEWVEGAFARFRVDALELVPKSGAPQRVYFYARDTHETRETRRAPHGYYDAKGQQPYHGTFRSPLPLARVTSRFNPKRMHPVLHVVMPHNGIDFGASTGTPVYASATGTVTTAGDSGPCGNMVQVEHPNGLTTAYCHLSRFAPGLHPGQHVEARQLVGYVGQSGRATGPHLHFAVKRGSVFIDPMAIKMDGVRVLPSVDRDAFAKRRADLDAALDAIALPTAGPSDPADDQSDGKDEPSGEE